MAGTKGGTVEITVLLKHICRLLTKYQSRIQTLINEGVIGGQITSAQAATINTFINAAAAACSAWEALTGY